MTNTKSDDKPPTFRAPVRVDSSVQRRPGGSYEVGAGFDGGSWHWRNLKARRKDAAAREASEGVAHLMKEHAERLEAQAQELLTKAAFLRDCARVKGVI